MTLETFHLCETGLTPETASGNAPEWVHLAPVGPVVARDGRRFILDEPELVIEAFEAHGADLPIDYEHQNNKPSLAGPVPAAGWITEMRQKDGGIWGRVKWTDRAAGMIRAREYRYLSPVLMCLKDRRVFKITGAGLVHNPALHLTALASEEDAMRDPELILQRLLEVLGIEPDADVETIVAAVEALKGQKKEGVDPAKYAPVEAMAELMREHSATVHTMRERNARTKVKEATDAGYLSGGMKDWALELCMKDEASFDQFISGTAAMFAHLLDRKPKPSYQPGKTQSETLHDAGVVETCAQLSISPDRLSR